MTKPVDIIGQRFGYLLVTGRAQSNGKRGACWHVRCDCGNATIARGDNLRRGRSRHCGCMLSANLQAALAQANLARLRRATGRQRKSISDMAELLAKRLLAKRGMLITPEQRQAVREAYR